MSYDARSMSGRLEVASVAAIFDFACKYGPAESYQEVPLYIALNGMAIFDDAIFDCDEYVRWGLGKTYQEGKEHRMLPWKKLGELRPSSHIVAEHNFDFIYRAESLVAACRSHGTWAQARRQGAEVACARPTDPELIALTNEWVAHVEPRFYEYLGRFVELIENERSKDPRIKYFSLRARDGVLVGINACWLDSSTLYTNIRMVANGYRHWTRFLLGAIAEWCAASGVDEINDGDADMKGLVQFKMSLKPVRFEPYFMTLNSWKLLYGTGL